MARNLMLVCALAAMAIGQSNASDDLKSIAVLQLGSSSSDSMTAKIISDAISDEIINKNFARVIERSQLERIIAEQGLQSSGACSGTECALEIGKLASVDQIIIGSIGKISESYMLSLRRVDIGTGRIISSSRRMQKGNLDDMIITAIPAATSDLFVLTNKIESMQAPSTLNEIKEDSLLATAELSLKQDIGADMSQPNGSNTVLRVTRWTAFAATIGFAIGAYAIQKSYENEKESDLASANYQNAVATESDATKTGKMICYVGGAASALVFLGTFAF